MDSKSDAPPLPTPPSREQNLEDTVAPSNGPQTNLVLQKVQEMLKNGQVTPEDEKALGMTKGEMEQFIEKFKKAPKATPRAGRQIDVKPGESENLKPSADLPGFNPQTSFSSKNIRTADSLGHDDVRGNEQGVVIQAPSDLQSRVSAYSKTIAESKSARAKRSARTGGGDR